MNIALCRLGLLLLGVITPPARYDYAWPGQGTVTFEVPSSWTMTGAPAGDAGFSFRAVPKSGAAASLQISLLNLPPDKALQATDLTDRLHDMVRHFIISSVEGKFAAQPLKAQQGSGCFVQFTDASLVGQPPQPDNYKIMRNGLLLLDERAVVVVTMRCDDPKAPRGGRDARARR